MKSTLTSVLQFATTALLLTTVGVDAQQASGYTLVPGAGHHMFDTETDLQNNYYGSLGLGYKFATAWGFEMTYQRSRANFQFNRNQADIEQLRVDALYHFPRQERTQPFAFLGGGQESWSINGNSFDNSIFNAGTGVKVWLNDWASLRSDVRLINDIDNERTSYAVSFALNLMLGGSSRATEPAIHLPADTDGDGIFDTLDRCPDSTKDATVDENGCAMVMDDDRDGVANTEDDCPDTVFGTKVDDSGCYIIISETEQLSLQIDFRPNSTQMGDNAYNKLQAIAEFMQQYPQAKLEIEGHTDNSGAASHNQRLSQQRADAVAKALNEQFDIEASRITATGFGQSRPLVSNDSAEGRATNRRVIATTTVEVERIAQ